MTKEEKKPSEQKVTKVPGRKQMTALWIAILTALGSTGIPKIVELVDSKPSAAEVQQMIATQTKDVSKQLNIAIDALKENTDTLKSYEKRLIRLETKMELVFARVVRYVPKETVKKAVAAAVKLSKPKKSPAMLLKKVPDFNIQQQLQVQTQEEAVCAKSR